MTIVFIGLRPPTASGPPPYNRGEFKDTYQTYCKIAGIDNTMPEIKFLKTGKPFFENSDVHFSISNKENIVLNAFGPSPVGVDIEFVKKINFKKISKRFFEAECKSAEEFFDLFTRKEAYIKMKGGTLAENIGENPPEISKNYGILPGTAIAVCTEDAEVAFIAR